MQRCVMFLACLLFLSLAPFARGEDRSFDGTGNRPFDDDGAAGSLMIRFGYSAHFGGPDGAIISDDQRANARDISNALFAQSTSVPNARNLSDYIWAWGQFVSHDTDLTTSSDGPEINGTAPIAINDPLDPLGPIPIPFTRSNIWPAPGGTRGQGTRPAMNEVTSFIDASHIYGSSAERAAALRTDGGLGAKLLTSANNLMPYNTADLPIENNGPLPNTDLFLAGDIRSNENSLLASLHTVFLREHNRLVDIIADQQPGLGAEEQFQLARKIVGAEMQVVTYNEFLPALLGSDESVPRAEDYDFNRNVDPRITTAYAHAAFRFGHSTVSPQLQLVDDDGNSAGSIDVRHAFYNPGILADTPENVDRLIKGASTQVSQEVDLLMVDELRNFLFGPPGAGGLDLAALNIQRGRDVGLPHFRALFNSRNQNQVGAISEFQDITSDASLAEALAEIYGNDINNIDAWVGMLAQDHVPGASVGPLLKHEIENQYERLRDGDRLFYLGNDAGLYTDGVLNPEIASIIDLDNLRLSDLLLANTALTDLPQNVFYIPLPGDYNSDGIVSAADYIVWRNNQGTEMDLPNRDPNMNGSLDQADYDYWAAGYRNQSGAGSPAAVATFVPEPTTFVLLLGSLLMGILARRRGSN
jgi:hypothetical protein